MSVTENEKARFASLCETVTGESLVRSNIGTYQEKRLHATLKRFYEPLPGLHEKKIGNYTVDIFNENGAIEIQTGSFYPLRKKLAALLPYTNVLVVHPMLTEKSLIWIDPETGSTTPPRRSPRHASVYDAARDFFWIRDLLPSPSLTVELLFLRAEEYRLRCGWSKDGKRGSVRDVVVPQELCDKVTLCGKDAYQILLPPELPDVFTAAELAAAIRRPVETARQILYVTKSCGIVSECGKSGRKKLYEKMRNSEFGMRNSECGIKKIRNSESGIKKIRN